MLITDGRVPVGDPAAQRARARPRRSRSAAPPSPGPTRSCATTASWSRARGRAAWPACPPAAATAATTCCRPATCPHDKIDLTCAAPVPGAGCAGGLRARGRRAARLPRWHRLLPPRACRCCARRRRVVRRPRAARPTPTGDRRARRAGRRRRRRAGAAERGRPGAPREPDLPQRDRHLRATPARGWSASTCPRRGRHRSDVAGLVAPPPGAAARGLPGPRLPQPHRRPDDRRPAAPAGRRARPLAHDRDHRRVDGVARRSTGRSCRRRSRRTPRRRSASAA